METITVLVCEPDKEPFVKTIERSLKSMQSIVGGYIEAINIDGGACLVCNEEGKLRGLALNRGLYIENENGEKSLNDVIAGTFFITDVDDGDFCGLSEERLMKYYAMFEDPYSWKADLEFLFGGV